MIPYKKPGRPTKRPTNAQLEMLYSAMTAGEIAKQFKVSETTVRNWLKKAREDDAKTTN